MAERLILSEVLSEIRNHIAFITLNRPAALNALSLGMVKELRTILGQCAADASVHAVLIRGAGEKAFCAGGDIRAIYESYQDGGAVHRDFFITEYPLDYLLQSYPKPYIALLDGIVMGGGMGIAQGSSLRIVGERTRMAMPEVAIGFFPDVGASYFLSRLEGSLGIYLALTGIQIRTADALYVGLADVFLPRASVAALESELAAMQWTGNDPKDRRKTIKAVVQTLANVDLPAAPLCALRPAIDQHFAAADVPALMRSLEDEGRPEYAEWAKQTLDILNTRSPTMLAVTLQLLQRGRTLTLAQCLRMELGLVWRCFAQGDFMEGVRAVLIDKDNTPLWQPSHIDEVTDAAIEAMFADPWAGATHPLANL
jgi:enoyl-CoA hydratase/carnithine racemase